MFASIYIYVYRGSCTYFQTCILGERQREKDTLGPELHHPCAFGARATAQAEPLKRWDKGGGLAQPPGSDFVHGWLSKLWFFWGSLE